MVDIHSHVLPGIDDGASTLAESQAMCELAVRDGTGILVVTPHQRHPLWQNLDPRRLRALTEQVQAAAPDGLRVLSGAEVRVDSNLLADVERGEAGGVLPLAGSRYLLLEFYCGRPEPDPLALLHELSVAGWQPIVAHPEFIPWIADDLRWAERLAERGALLQITAMSLTGDFGRPPQAVCERLLEARLVHFVASDGHSSRHRPPGLGRAHAALVRLRGEETAWRLTCGNPAAVIENRPLPVEALQ